MRVTLSLPVAKLRGVLLIVALLLLPVRHAVAADKIILGFVSHGALQWPEYTAQSFGWFKENGVEVDMVTVGGGAAQQLVAGAINIGYSGFPDFIRAANQGAPLKIVINGIGTPPYAIYAKPAIKSIRAERSGTSSCAERISESSASIRVHSSGSHRARRCVSSLLRSVTLIPAPPSFARPIASVRIACFCSHSTATAYGMSATALANAPPSPRVRYRSKAWINVGQARCSNIENAGT